MITSEIKELKVLQCDLNGSLSLGFCQQSLFPYLVSRDLQQHGAHYSPKTRDLLRELVFLSKLEQEIRLSSIVTVFWKLREVFSKVKLGRNTEAYWMRLDESEELLECVNREIFCVLDEKKRGANDENELSESKSSNNEPKSSNNEPKSSNNESKSSNNESKSSNNEPKSSSKSTQSQTPNAPIDPIDSTDSTATEHWLQPPEKWAEARRILSDLNAKGSPSDRKCVLLSVLNMKVLAELHNFLLAPAFYCLLSLRRLLNRALDAKTLSSREAKLLAEVRRRLEGKLPPTWRENWLTFQRITEIESDRDNSVELPRSFSPFAFSLSDFPQPARGSLLGGERGLFAQSVRSPEAQRGDRSGRRFGADPPGRSRHLLAVSLSFSTAKRRLRCCSISTSSATKAPSSRTTSQSSS